MSAAQSELGKMLNKIMLETGKTPMEVMSAYMEQSALKVGGHTFMPKRETK